MKKVNKILILFIILIDCLFSQQQVKIPWPSLANSPWPVLRGDMQGTGRSEYIGPRTNNVIWRKDMPLGIIYGPVIGYNDVLYMGERALSLDSVNYFYSIDKNGNNIWTFNTNSYFANNSGPVIRSDGSIYFFSADRKGYCVSEEGSLIWMINISANFRPFYSLSKNGDLYVPTTDTLFIISSDGQKKLQKYIPDISPNIVFSTGGDTIYLTTGGPATILKPGSIKATDTLGNLFWTRDFWGINWGVPVVDNKNKIYFFATDSVSWIDSNYTVYSYLYSFNPDGSVHWKYRVNGYSDYTAPTIDKFGNIIFSTRKIVNNDYKYCIISLNYFGNENWVKFYEEDGLNFMVNHGLVCDNEGKIYFGSSYGGYFYCLDSYGELLWKLDLGDLEYDSCPAIGSDGTLYIGTHKSSLFPYHTQNLIAVKDSPTVVEDYQPVLDYNLEQNYPNPFNPITIIKYEVLQISNVKIEVFDLLGRVIKVLVDEVKTAGRYEIKFDASSLASGIYYYRIKANEFVQTKKMMLMK
jgi:hypothetical protein